MKLAVKGLYNMPGSKYFWYRWTQDGKRRAVSLKTDDLSEAIKKVKEIRAGALFARWERAAPLATPASKLVEDYLTAAQKRGKKPMRAETAKRVRYIIEKFVVEREIQHVGQITQGEISEWLARKKAGGVSADTLWTYAVNLRTFLRYLVKSKLARADLLSDFQVPDKGAHGRKNWLKWKDVTRVIGEAQDDDLCFVLYAGFHAGLRKNEICHARVGWFDLEAGSIHVQNDPKSGFILKDRENRSIPLTKAFKDFLTDFLRDRDVKEYVIRPAKEQAAWRYRYDFNRVFKSHMKRCGVTCSIHDMRRSFASNYVSHGESIYIVAGWLGDGVQVVERSYGHLAPSAGNINRLA
jgi:integrase